MDDGFIKLREELPLHRSKQQSPTEIIAVNTLLDEKSCGWVRRNSSCHMNGSQH